MHLPLYQSVLFPANSAIVNAFVLSFVSFDLIPTGEIDKLIYDDLSQIPEVPYNMNFEEAGYGSK